MDTKFVKSKSITFGLWQNFKRTWEEGEFSGMAYHFHSTFAQKCIPSFWTSGMFGIQKLSTRSFVWTEIFSRVKASLRTIQFRGKNYECKSSFNDLTCSKLLEFRRINGGIHFHTFERRMERRKARGKKFYKNFTTHWLQRIAHGQVLPQICKFSEGRKVSTCKACFRDPRKVML